MGLGGFFDAILKLPSPPGKKIKTAFDFSFGQYAVGISLPPVGIVMISANESKGAIPMNNISNIFIGPYYQNIILF